MQSLLKCSAVLLLWATGLGFACATEIHQQIEQFGIERFNDGRLMIEGPRIIEPAPTDPAASCRALYQRRMALQRNLDDYKPAYWEDPRNQTAVFLGTIWVPAFYFLAYSAVTTHLDELKDYTPQTEIDALRRASAALRCFEK